MTRKRYAENGFYEASLWKGRESHVLLAGIRQNNFTFSWPVKLIKHGNTLSLAQRHNPRNK